MCLTIACEAFCCAGTSFCNLACCCCKWLVQSTLKEQIKLTYILTNYVIMTLTIIVLYYLQDFYINYLKYFGCPETIQSLCMGFSGIYRMSFVLTLFYFIILLFMFVKGTIAKMVNDGLWLLKFIIIAVCFYGTLYMSNSFFEKYITVCNVTSGFYQLFQVLIFIDIFYLWAEKWARMYDDGVEGMGSALVAAASITYTIAIILNIYNFIWFDHHYLIILLNVAVIIILTIVQMCGFNPSGSLIATGCIACYMTYQIYCALSSYPDANVNVFYDSQTNVTVQMFINGFLNFVALIYLIFATKEMSKQSLRVLDSNLDKREPKPVEIEMTHTQKVEEVKVLLEELELQPYNTNQFIAFHIIMIFCSMYMAMMITNWGSPTISGQSFQLFMPSELSYYVKLGTSGICSLLYLWSLIAPKVFPERFS